MTMYSTEEAFERLKSYKLTTHKESVRRWLRQGVIKGIAPSTRKSGWKIPKEALDDFIQQRLPYSYTTIVAKEVNETNTTNILNSEIEEQIRKEMWLELAKKNIWEGFIEIKKLRLHECIQHRHYSVNFENEVWQRCIANSRAYKKPRVSYLLEAFGFEGKRLLLDQNFEDLEEQIIFAIIEHVRLSLRGPIN